MKDDCTKKSKLIVIAGPTAVGKTALSVKLAKAVGGEIINTDSVQVYRGMNIGSAKVTVNEMDGVPHHLIDVFDPNDNMDLWRFKNMANRVIKEIYLRGNVPILTGGTGFYLRAVAYDTDLTKNGADKDLRDSLQKIADEQGAETLHDILKEKDPESADAIHPNNIRKVIRALEFYEQCGKTISSHNATQRGIDSPYDLRYLVLTMPRDKLYDRINLRVDKMIENGLEEEVKGLLDSGVKKDTNAMQAIGYKEMAEYLDGLITKDKAIEKIKKATRHYAKRQITWFKREKDAIFIDLSKHTDEKEFFSYVISLVGQ